MHNAIVIKGPPFVCSLFLSPAGLTVPRGVTISLSSSQTLTVFFFPFLSLSVWTNHFSLDPISHPTTRDSIGSSLQRHDTEVP